MLNRRIILTFGLLLSLFAVAGASTAMADESAKTASCMGTEMAPFEGTDLMERALDTASAEEVLVCAPEAPEATDSQGIVGMPIDDLADRAVVCLLIPQCSANADCDAGCGGAHRGRCVHNPCPARVCRCR